VKFNNGYWLLRDGVTARYAAECFDVRTTDATISAAVLGRPVEHRGSHLNTATITVDVSSAIDDVIGVRISHFTPIREPSVRFALNGSEPEVTVERDDHSVSLRSGRLAAHLATSGPWTMSFTGDGRPLTSAGPKSTASMTVDGDGEHMVQRLRLPVGTSVYGLGERFTPFVKNGQVVDIWNEDGGTSSERSYKAIPFLLTDAGFGIFVDSPGRVSFEIASEVVSAIQFSLPGPTMTYHVIYGATPRQILERYTALTGRPALPPLWSFGLWLSTSFTTDYSEETVTHFVDGMADRGIPLSVFHFDCYWMKPLNWCDFTWDRDAFPDPPKMLQRLAERDLHVSVWINPYVGQRSPMFAEAAEAGYLLKRPDGSIWQWDMWVAGMALVDFTNPEARAWFSDKITELLRSGVHAIKADFGERIPTDVVWHDGSDPELMHNYYSYLYNETVFETVEREQGRAEAVLFARSATAGGQQFPVHWGGDCEATYESMAESLRAGLSLGVSGFGFWSHDIGGFEGTPSPALYKRWLLFGLFSSHARLHGSDSYRVPWVFDEEAVDIARRFVRLRNRLAPYYWAHAVEAHEHGIPMMRPMFLEFPADRSCAPLDLQYMLGSDLLVAPVFADDGMVEFYVPDGVWTDLLDGHTVQGPAWVTEQHGFDSLPVMVRPGTVIVWGGNEERPHYDHGDSPTFEVFALPDGGETSAQLFDGSGERTVAVTVRRAGEVLTATVTAGAEALSAGWTLRWVDGPLGPDRGPSATAAPSQTELHLPIG
jgi:alpha-D-xyloside xylohydrolase